MCLRPLGTSAHSEYLLIADGLKTHTEHPTEANTASHVSHSPWAREQILLDHPPRQAQPGRTQFSGPWQPGQPSLFLKAPTGAAQSLGVGLAGARGMPRQVLSWFKPSWQLNTKHRTGAWED